MIEITFRPMPLWPYPETDDRRSRWAFKADWNNTMRLLRAELWHLDAENVVIGLQIPERSIRQDGGLRGDAKDPTHPGIELSFDAWIANRRQRLCYAVDSCDWWRHNVRSAALGLESLRAVDRYGITRTGEQYAGFKALPASTANPSVERGAKLIGKHGSIVAARRATHPDHGGEPREFADVQAAIEAGVQ